MVISPPLTIHIHKDLPSLPLLQSLSPFPTAYIHQAIAPYANAKGEGATPDHIT